MRTQGPEGLPERDRRPHELGVLNKALDVLEVLVADGPLGLGELTSATGANKAAVYRVLSTLTSRGYVAKDASSRKYRSGPALLGLARLVADAVDLAQVARPYLARLREEFDETVNLGALEDGDVQYLDILESSHSLRMAAQPGLRDSLHSTALGKAMLSALGPDRTTALLEGRQLARKTDRTITDLGALLDDLEGARRRGYAIDDQENEVGAICIAAPVLGAPDRPVAAISVSGPAARLVGGSIVRIGEGLAKTAADLAGAVGAGRGATATP